MAEPLARQLGRILTNARGPRSRRSLADDLEVSNTALLALEAGQGNPTFERAERMAAAYGVELTITARRVRRPATTAAGIDEASTRPAPPTATARA